MEQFIQQLASGLANGAIYACVALALVMIYVSTDHINFAQGEMAMFSTYISWQLMSWGLSFWVAFVCAVVASFVLGVVIERVILRPLRNAPVLSVVGGAGTTVAHIVALDPNMMSGILLYAFASALVGGIGNPGGAVIGGFIVGVLENMVAYAGNQIEKATGVYIIGNGEKLTVALI